MKKVFISLVVTLVVGNVGAQTEGQIKDLSAAIVKACSKKKISYLEKFQLNKESLYKYLIPAIISEDPSLAESEDFKAQIEKEMPSFEAEYKAGFEALLSGIETAGYSKFSYLSHQITQSSDVIGNLSAATISIVFKDKSGKVFSLGFKNCLITDVGPLLAPEVSVLHFNMVQACGCLSGMEFLDESLVGTFSGECSFLNDYDMMGDAGRFCGLDHDYGYEEEYAEEEAYSEEDYYASINLCDCRTAMKEYSDAMSAAMNLPTEKERRNQIYNLNEEYYNTLSDCYYKEQMMIEELGEDGLETEYQNCD